MRYGRACLVVIVLLVAYFTASGHASARARTVADMMLRDNQVRLAAGGEHTCQINQDGTVRCWGRNNHAQLALADIEFVSTPVRVGGLTGAVAIATGEAHSCALLVNGRVSCWGLALGFGADLIHAQSPTEIPNIANAVAISAGVDHSCALLANGTARCWGDNSFGQLGSNTVDSSRTPITVGGLSNAVGITSGAHHNCALLANGTVRCWGLNATGALGDGTKTNRSAPTVVGGLTNAVALAAGQGHTCALLARGSVHCWGRNDHFQSAFQAGPLLTPTLVHDDLRFGTVAITAGASHTCALLATGLVKCWGDSRRGQVGVDGIPEKPTFVFGLSSIVAISAGGSFTCALTSNGSTRCWGANDVGQLGNGTRTDSPQPTSVFGVGTTAARNITAGAAHTCVVRASSAVSCWGYNVFGQVGDNSLVSKSTPVPVSGLSNTMAVAGGLFHTCALLANGRARCWGDNTDGQLGDGSTVPRRLFPVAASGLSSAIALAAGSAHTCALDSLNVARCWGNNDYGQIGDGTTVGKPMPTRPIGLTSNVIAIGAGASHTCALIGDGSLRCWGDNSSGQLGDGSTVMRIAPVAVANVTNAIALAVGSFHTCALLANGAVRCWGTGDNGQLGDGFALQRTLPVTVTGLTNAVALAAGAEHTCALLADGTARCWGSNTSGQLGDGTFTPRLTPVAVKTRIPFGFFVLTRTLQQTTQIAAGSDHTCVTTASGGVFCWGNNFAGEIGDGTTTTRPFATAVASF